MTCQCGHASAHHTDDGCTRFSCCDRTPDRRIGHRGEEHDFVTHTVVRCDCHGYTKPPGPYGLTAGVSDTDYHADRATLSSTGARKLLDCPARFKWNLDNGQQTSSAALEFGKLAHAVILGEGAEIVVIDAEDWRSKAAREQRAAAGGALAVLRSEYQTALAMRDAVMAHPTASALFAEGDAELSGWWTDERSSVRLRFRPDWMTALDFQPVCVDLKTTVNADPAEFARSVAKFGYHAQARWYLDGLAAHGVADARFLFVCVEKTAPYPVSVIELDADALAEGGRRNRAAIDLYARCLETGHWPAYGDLINTVSLPRWAFTTEGN